MVCSQAAGKDHRFASLPELTGVVFGKQAQRRRYHAAEKRKPRNPAVDMSRQHQIRSPRAVSRKIFWIVRQEDVVGSRFRRAELSRQFLRRQHPFLPAFVIISFVRVPPVDNALLKKKKKMDMFIVKYEYSRFSHFRAKFMVMFHPDLVIPHRVIYGADTGEFPAQGNT